MANPLKSQFDLQIGKETYKARLTIDALVQIEQKVGCGIIKLAQNMAEGDIGITDTLSVLTHALRGGGNDFDEKKVGNIISKVGIVEATKSVATLLTQTLLVEEQDESEDSKKKLESEQVD